MAAKNGREECGNAACPGGWRGWWKDHRRPMLEGRWGCSPGCLETMARAALRREAGGEQPAEPEGEHRHRMPLGLILLGQGWITPEQLQRAMERQRRVGRGPIGAWLTEECGLEPSCVTRGLGLQWGCPVLSAGEFDPQAMALAAPQVLVERLGMVPLRVAGGRLLYLGFAGRPDWAAALAMERISGLKVESGLLEEMEWRAARQRLCACEFVDAELEPVERIELLPGRIAAALVRMQPRASRLVRVHEFHWLRMWLDSRAMGASGLPQSKEDVADRVYVVGREA